ncbi:hypothetical protein EJB05_27200 [Eragrostis curvula]|uniref:Uncharacterized protein n=1 Tax=Eragrostis curvula TaxID=38414 RepID=A0A5J9UMF3_9POAL|nr:hypothetical protein EJB05_27200 [Eragrostis curvula]
MFMRLNTPLIGVRYWKDVKPNVKSAIIEQVMRDPETGAEPGQMNFLRLLTRRKDNGQNAAARKLTLEDSDESGEQESRCTSVLPAKEDLAFQEAYKETTRTKLTKSHGHGYLANPTKNQLLKERIKEQERELTHETNNETQDEARSLEENSAVTPLHHQETPNQTESTSMVTTERENVNPNCNTRAASKFSKNLFTDNRVNGPPAKFITSQQLLSGAAKTRASKRKQVRTRIMLS